MPPTAAPATHSAAANDLPPVPAHPMDSSRILLAMTVLAKKAAASTATDELSAIVSRPVVKTLLGALNYRDERVLSHSRRVAMLAVGMAQQLGWEGRGLRVLEAAALLHDVGKVGLTDSVLKKPGRLSEDEAEYIARHHRIACNLLQAFRVDPEAISIISQSHRYVNGSLDGSGRVGREMALGARILAVADAYDSLTNDQAFRAAKSHRDAMVVLEEGAGSRFDGNVVAALHRWSKGEGLDFIMQGADVKVMVTDTASVSRSAVAEAGMLCHLFSYLNVLETLYDGFYVLDSDMRFVIWSAGAENLTGRNASDVIGQAYHRSFISGQDAAEGDDPSCLIKDASTAGHTVCREMLLQHVDGASKSVEVQAIPLFDDGGSLQGVAQIFNDLNAGKQSGQYRDLRAAASRDPLTGIANRRELESQAADMFEKFSKASPARRDDDRFSVIFADIDHFKALNDTYGHAFGDRVLIDFATTLFEETFNGELVARYGGEEFVVIVPERRIQAASELAERLRQTITRLRFEDEPNVKITCSFGVAEVRDADTPESLFERADKALFEAKRSGRNCVKLGEASQPLKPTQQSNRMELVGAFEACTQSDMIVYKLSGFVDETKAKLKSVDESKVVMQLGKAGLFGGWGDEPTEQPIEVVVEIGSQREARGAAKYVPIRVHITPKGRHPKPEVFDYRASRVLQALRSYLVARETT